MDGGESEQPPKAPSAVETLVAKTHSVLAKSDIAHHSKKAIIESGEPGATLASQSGVPDTTPTPTDPKDEELVRLQRKISELKTASQAKEVQLRSAKAELHNARETLNATFEEYSSLREELKTIKQTLGSDHQAVVYRKDIELFALRKGNDQKEKYIQERDAKLDDMYRQHRATLEVKDAQLKLLKDRLTSMDRQPNPKLRHKAKQDDGADQALEVRLLRVRKGKDSLGSDEEEKDAIIAKLQEDLAVATKAAEAIINQQAELQRAWDIAKKIQSALKEEKEQHAQTREQLQEATVKLSEKEGQAYNVSALKGRLPTIDENEHDTKELEAMFDTAQEDNLRLYTEVEALEKRLRDANARMFAAEQSAEILKEQVRLEKAINEELESARPSVVHHVHFQRMEGQLKESQDTILAKDEEIELLKSAIAQKDYHVKDLQGEVHAAVSFHSQDQDEIERLKQAVSGLQATKEQLMLDHERLASQRTRQRVVTADRTSARSSGATLIQESTPRLTRRSDEPVTAEVLPPMPSLVESNSNESIQLTPKRHVRSVSTPNRWSLISNDVPPPELRELKSTRRKSLGFKDLMKRMVRKDNKSMEVKVRDGEKINEDVQDTSHMENTRVPKGLNGLLRSKTASSSTAATAAIDASEERPHTPTKRSTSQRDAQSDLRGDTRRYYATEGVKGNERPKTATAEEASRPVSRRSWAATNKLKRKSLY
ncbi:Nn.00g079580.m01.CDS01 [Neocucurbitaria sp. VM-36]